MTYQAEHNQPDGSTSTYTDGTTSTDGTSSTTVSSSTYDAYQQYLAEHGGALILLL